MQFNFGSGYPLLAGTTYALQVNSDTSGLYTTVDTTGSYSRGVYLTANAAQTYWNNHAGAWDIWFEEWGGASGTTPPSITTSPATGISSTTATLNGNLSAMGSATIANVSFEYGLTTSYGSTAPAIPASLTMPGTFSANLAGLSAGTTYHYRARASGGTDGISYGSDRSFATIGGPTTPPSVTTNPATSISTTTATLNGNLSAMGSATIANVSFEYGLTTSYGDTATGSPATRTVPGIFSAALAGLNVGTTYHYRAKADGGSAGIAYGSDQSFTTSTPGGSSILFENYHATQNSSGVGLHAAQTFTPQTTHTITSAKVRLFNTGATGSVSVSIRAVDAAGIPTGANLVTSTPVANSAIPGAWTAVQFNFGSGYPLLAGTTYALQVNSDTSGLYTTVDTTRKLQPGRLSNPNAAQTYWNNHAGAWDIWFEEWGTK